MKSAQIKRRLASRNLGITIQNEKLVLTIHYRFGCEKNVDSENSIDLLFSDHSRDTGRRADVRQHHWHIDNVEGAEAKTLDNRQFVGHAIDHHTRWERRIA